MNRVAIVGAGHEDPGDPPANREVQRGIEQRVDELAGATRRDPSQDGHDEPGHVGPREQGDRVMHESRRDRRGPLEGAPDLAFIAGRERRDLRHQAERRRSCGRAVHAPLGLEQDARRL